MNNLTIRAIDNEWFAVFINGLFNHETCDLNRLIKLIGIKRLEGFSVHFE